MKKINYLGIMPLALAANSIASEVKVNLGYDVNRDWKISSTHFLFIQRSGLDPVKDYKLKNGPVIGVEYLFDNQGEAEFGVGIEHKLSGGSKYLKNKETNQKTIRITPVYLTAKHNLINKNGNDLLYTIGRVGYAFANESKDYKEADLKGGLYMGAGIGTEYGPVSVEALYERANFKYQAHGPVNVRRARKKIDSIGLRVGYRFGDIKNVKENGTNDIFTSSNKGGEIRVNTGYSFSRRYKVPSDHLGLRNFQGRPGDADYNMKNGPVLGVEWLFDNQGEAEFGVGMEYKFSNNSKYLKDKSNKKVIKMLPVYVTGKYNIINKDGNDLLYGVGRLGWGSAKSGSDNGEKVKGRLYYAAGIGTEYGPVSAELLYERSDFKSSIHRPKVDSFGIRIGYRFGNTENRRSNKKTKLYAKGQKINLEEKEQHIITAQKENISEEKANTEVTYSENKDLEEKKVENKKLEVRKIETVDDEAFVSLVNDLKYTF